jgi:cell division protein FtsI (penicillin-binding protein 3)
MNKMYLRKSIKPLASAVVTLLMCACQGSKTAGCQTIDSAINQYTDSVLACLKDEHHADSGLIMVVDTHTGYIMAASEVGCTDNDIMDNFRRNEYSCLEKVATWLAALESGRITTGDTIDTYDGSCIVYGRELNDMPESRHGRMTFHDAFVQQSNIATYKAASLAYKNNVDSLTEGIRITGLNVPQKKYKDKSEIVWTSLGYGYKMSAWDMIEYINGIVNGGTMVKLMSVNGLVQVIQDKMAAPKNIRGIRNIFEDKENLKKLNLSDESPTGTICTVTTPQGPKSVAEYKVELCGYFPTDKPKYTIYICAYRQDVGELYDAVCNLYLKLMKYLSAR